MRNFRLLGYLLALSLFIYSCDSSRDETPLGEFERGLLIINEGNFSSRDGDVSHYNFTTGEVQQNIFEQVNSRPFAGVLQDLVPHNDFFYLVSNTGKVEIVNKNTFQSVGSVEGSEENPELIQPRSLIVADNKLYISDHGPYDSNWQLNDSYIAVVDNLSGGQVSKRIPTSSSPEKLYKINNDILIACRAARTIDVLPIGGDEVERSVEVVGTPASFIELDGKLLLFARTSTAIYFHEINRTNYNISNTTEIAIQNATPRIALAENGEAYIVSSSGYPDYFDMISKISITSGQIIDSEFYQGRRMYGIGYDAVEKRIYVSDDNGLQGSGTAIVLDQNGEQVKTIPTGVAPSGFYFRR
ncbi:YncE family protein [Belliella kenyensis]|uniref:YncE family protein n=1 Tax=Belliella kenyensis TaxID=1472724 RepID=A0ABV8EJD2_9BACT|nr:DUF5074 domain-containing protein [Belliella kenyensis]MCH7400953.1 surface layer protein [Belliella kenyensis]MDN3603951.1 surface layer protein [Belliella kenyensis]